MFILLHNKNKKITDTTWIIFQKCAELKESDLKEYILQLFHLHKILEQMKFTYSDRKQIRLPSSRRRSSSTKEVRPCLEGNGIKCVEVWFICVYS